MERTIGKKVDFSMNNETHINIIAQDWPTESYLEGQSSAANVALQHLAQGVLLFDEGGGLILFNSSFCTLYGVSPKAFYQGMTLGDVRRVCGEAGCRSGRGLGDIIKEPEDLSSKSNETIVDWRHDDRIIEIQTRGIESGGWINTFEDITDRQRVWDQLSFRAHHDPLTGLANRHQFKTDFEAAIYRSRSTDDQLAILCLDLDRFKSVNDSLGHKAGDVILQQVADRLTSLTRKNDVVARTGGDEFIILNCGLSQPEAAIALATKVVESLSNPFDVHGNLIRIATSIGIARFPADGKDAGELLHNADVALYCAKANGRGSYAQYDHAIGEQKRIRRQLEADLRSAIGTTELDMHYQPIFDCDRDALRGFEALMRWTHPALGSISPETFIPIAEETGLIGPLGLWALETACGQAAKWPGRLSVAVNLSPAQFTLGSLHEDIARILSLSGLLPSRLELEVTESLLLANTEQALLSLRAIRALGVGLALDDFGTGYSSLGYLQQFPFSRLKIARSFVQVLNKGKGADGIVAAIIAMSRSLYMDVTAEGVETAEQMAVLRQLGCQTVQGNFLGKPIASSAILDFLRQH